MTPIPIISVAYCIQGHEVLGILCCVRGVVGEHKRNLSSRDMHPLPKQYTLILPSLSIVQNLLHIIILYPHQDPTPAPLGLLNIVRPQEYSSAHGRQTPDWSTVS